MDGRDGGGGSEDELRGQRDGSAEASGNLDKVTLLGLGGSTQTQHRLQEANKLMRTNSTRFKHIIRKEGANNLL